MGFSATDWQCWQLFNPCLVLQHKALVKTCIIFTQRPFLLIKELLTPKLQTLTPNHTHSYTHTHTFIFCRTLNKGCQVHLQQMCLQVQSKRLALWGPKPSEQVIPKNFLSTEFFPSYLYRFSTPRLLHRTKKRWVQSKQAHTEHTKCMKTKVVSSAIRH